MLSLVRAFGSPVMKSNSSRNLHSIPHQQKLVVCRLQPRTASGAVVDQLQLGLEKIVLQGYPPRPHAPRTIGEKCWHTEHAGGGIAREMAFDPSPPSNECLG
jgi:hypothetical protein